MISQSKANTQRLKVSHSATKHLVFAMQSLNVLVSSIIVIFIATLATFSIFYPEKSIPEHLLQQKASFIPNFLTENEIDDLRKIIFQMADFPSNAQDTQVSPSHVYWQYQYR